jgi:hypothetical protein
MNPRRPPWAGVVAVLATALLLVLALAACGGSGGSGSSSTEAAQADGAPVSGSADAGKTQGAPASGPGSKPSAADAAGAVDPPAGTPTTTASAPAPVRRKARLVRRRLAGKAGAAAPFLVAQGDNSIPTYGSEAQPGQLAAAEGVLSGYLGARAAGDWAGACSLMSAAAAKQVVLLGGEPGNGGTSCAAAYAKLSERAPPSERADPLVDGLTALRVESPHAFALFYGSGEQQYMMPLEEESGGWRVTQIAPLPWPIGSSAGY